MRVRSEILVGVGALLAVQVATTLAAIGLLARMSPAVERILEENVATLTAVEDMLAALAVEDGATVATRSPFAEALARARANVTEPEEVPLLAEIDGLAPAAVAGDPVAVREVVARLEELSDVNRRSMARMDARARQLGMAGAWAAVGLGTIGFVMSVGVSRRLARRIEEPLAEVDAALAAAGHGDIHRRCIVREGPSELVRIAREVNELLDGR